MPEKNVDKRTLRTRKAIATALAELLTEKPLHRVTVQEIADKADVNRVTFYKHYLDVYDLYEKLEQSVLVELGLLIIQLEELDPEASFAHLIDYILEYKAVFKMIFSPNSTCTLRDKFSKMTEGLFLQMQSEKLTGVSSEKLEYLSCYRSNGCLSIISKWVMSDCTEPKKFIIRMISDLDSNTVSFYTGKTR